MRSKTSSSARSIGSGSSGGELGSEARSDPGDAGERTGRRSISARYDTTRSTARWASRRNVSASSASATAERLLDLGDDEHQHVAADPELHLVSDLGVLDALGVDEGAVRGPEVA